MLSDTDRGQLLIALLEYAKDGKLPEELSELSNMAFVMIRPDLDEWCTRYNKKVEASRKNGRYGGRPKVTQTQQNPANPVGSLQTQQNPVGINEVKSSEIENEVKSSEIENEVKSNEVKNGEPFDFSSWI